MATKKRVRPPKGPNLKRGGFTDASWRFEERDKARAKALSADTPEPEFFGTAHANQPPDRIMQNLGRIATALEDIATFMRVITSPPGMATPTAEIPLQTYLSGQWRRRAGDVYARVAEPGSPNAVSHPQDGETK